MTEAISPVIDWTGDSYLDGTFQVLAENIIVAETKCLITAFLCYLGSFYIFNLAFPKKICSTLTFLQNVVLGHVDDTKTSTKVVNLLIKVNK